MKKDGKKKVVTYFQGNQIIKKVIFEGKKNDNNKRKKD